LYNEKWTAGDDLLKSATFKVVQESSDGVAGYYLSPVSKPDHYIKRNLEKGANDQLVLTSDKNEAALFMFDPKQPISIQRFGQGIDAAFQGTDGIYLFKGNSFLKFDNFDDGYGELKEEDDLAKHSGTFIKDYFGTKGELTLTEHAPGFLNGIDAAAVYNGHLYFVKGKAVVEFDSEDYTIMNTLTTDDLEWLKTDDGYIDALLTDPSGHPYVFRKGVCKQYHGSEMKEMATFSQKDYQPYRKTAGGQKKINAQINAGLRLRDGSNILFTNVNWFYWKVPTTPATTTCLK
jgi:hypothetical protein